VDNRINRCFELLEISPDATYEEAKAAYRLMAQVWHPDKHSLNDKIHAKATSKFKELNAAWSDIQEYFKNRSANEASSRESEQRARDEREQNQRAEQEKQQREATERKEHERQSKQKVASEQVKRDEAKQYKSSILFVVVALFVGLIIGVIYSKENDKSSPSFPAIAAQQGETPVNTQQDEAKVKVQQNIQMLENFVVNDPQNRNAWVELGNAYFDAQLPNKSVEAYAKALELNPNDPNVLNDQGVMYRQLGWFDKAIGNFTKANQIDPQNLQSLYNFGIIYRYDLQDFVKATEVWKKYLMINPTGEFADRVREEIRQMESQQPR
jgi:cytochrome c-type biogenesis protein CcmH/NrfG